jgi:membrane AbrB-like protein
VAEYFEAIKKSYKSIIIGAIGGYLGTLVHLPLPWLLGALLLNLLVSFTSYKITFDKKIFLPVLLIIGVILAGSFNITLLYKIHLWIYSSIAMIICTIIGSIVVAFYFYKVCKFRKLVAVLAGLPGAFVVIAAAINQMTDSKKESGQVVIPQATRVLFIVLILPFVFVTQVGYQEISSHGNNPDYSLRYFLELIFLLGIAQLGSMGLKRLKVPSAPILAAMILCGIFYTFEITTARFPDFFINIAFVFLGSAIGCRLSGLPIKEIGYYSLHGFIVSVLLLGIAAIFAYLLKIFLGFDFMAAFLSFAPGGLHEMVVISIAYNIDPLFVTYHHFLRIFLIIFSIPFILKFFSKR